MAVLALLLGQVGGQLVVAALFVLQAFCGGFGTRLGGDGAGQFLFLVLAPKLGQGKVARGLCRAVAGLIGRLFQLIYQQVNGRQCAHQEGHR
ncbi:hypothetical protein EA796_00815 [Pseudomonas sp. AOB-7]|nr:hypothetical protein EA796_00815 [Pseudomonas sp. AOB-7]